MVLISIALVVGAFWPTGRGGRAISSRILATSDPTKVAGGRTTTFAPLHFQEGALKLGRFFSPLGARIVPLAGVSTSELRRRLVQAGYMQPSAIGWYYVTRILLAVSLPFAVLTLVPLALGGVSIPIALLMFALSGIIGLYLPPLFINRRMHWLQTKYRNAFPDVLDLLLICIEAGLGLDSAIGRVATEVGAAHPELGNNLRILESELRAGKTRQDALRSLADRLGIDEARSLVMLLVQSEELGASIADALRVYSDEMRTKRMVEAERRANALPVKLAIPLVLSVFPVLLIVILLPVVIRIRNAMF